MVKLSNIAILVHLIVLSIFAFLVWLWFCLMFLYLKGHTVLYSKKIMP